MKLRADLAIPKGVHLSIASPVPERWSSSLTGSEVRCHGLRPSDGLDAITGSLEVDVVLVDDPTRRDAIVAACRRVDVPWVEIDGGPDRLPSDIPDDALLDGLRSRMHLHYADEDRHHQGPWSLLGKTPVMVRLDALLQRAAPGLSPVLIRGEAGSGKELAARAIHEQSDRRDGPFLRIHCATLPESLLRSELFGYDAGAFVGALEARPGRVEQARGGTLLLDEVGWLSPACQADLLHLAREKEIHRLGSRERITADLRLITTAQSDLEAMMAAGTFREDLFYGLNGVPVWLPPLRARRSDIRLLADHFCEVHAEAYGRPGLRLSHAASERLTAASWPGNVRELQDFVERLVVLGGRRLIDAEQVDEALAAGSLFATAPSPFAAASAIRLNEALISGGNSQRPAERAALERALAATNLHRGRTARVLGISRARLFHALKDHGLS
ncbi:MAG: sigma-54-dependent Fis family transcriptional regulator [Myxococcales bacterium]|nr:sigma-54-dependent Fis family transcriptional regulator [Myxococcales bacterium]